jgi:SAM-dependent methyltransferase
VIKHAKSFGAAAEDYDRFRPQPSPEALDWLLRPGDREIVDVGAGTGQLTRLLVDRGAMVTAIEPDPAMRQALAARVPGARVAAGVAERLPLSDGSQDAVLSHAAWHWFHARRSVREAARVLRPGGRLGALRTGFDPELDWLGDLWDRLEPDPSARRPGGRARHRPRLRRASLGARFTRREHLVVRFRRRFTSAQLLGLMGTYSGLLVRPPDERAALLDDVRELIEARLGGGEEIEVPMLTSCWRADRRR